jgi:hypothetical protein
LSKKAVVKVSFKPRPGVGESKWFLPRSHQGAHRCLQVSSGLIAIVDRVPNALELGAAVREDGPLPRQQVGGVAEMGSAGRLVKRDEEVRCVSSDGLALLLLKANARLGSQEVWILGRVLAERRVSSYLEA